MKFVHGFFAVLIFVMFAFGVCLAAAENPGRENASSQLSNHKETVSVADSRQSEPDDKLNSPPAQKSDTAEDISDRIFSRPEFYFIPCRDYHRVLADCRYGWRAARSEFTKNRSWTYGFDEARKRGYRLARKKDCCEDQHLKMYLDRPLIPHPKYDAYHRPLDLEFWIPNH